MHPFSLQLCGTFFSHNAFQNSKAALASTTSMSLTFTWSTSLGFTQNKQNTDHYHTYLWICMRNNCLLLFQYLNNCIYIYSTVVRLSCNNSTQQCSFSSGSVLFMQPLGPFLYITLTVSLIAISSVENINQWQNKV